MGFLICVLIKQDSECYLPSAYSVGRTELAVSPPCFIVRQTSTCVLKTRTHDYNQIFSSLSWMQSKQELINSSFETEGTLNTHTGYVSSSTRAGIPRIPTTARQSVTTRSVFPLKPKLKPGTETKPHYKIPSWLIGVCAGEVKSL